MLANMSLADLVGKYVATLDEVLGHPIRSDHSAIIIEIPEGAWRWSITEVVDKKHWRPAKIKLCTSFAVAHLSIFVGSEADEADLVLTSLRDEDEEPPVRTIHFSGKLSLFSLRSFIMRLLTDYAPLSVNITTTE